MKNKVIEYWSKEDFVCSQKPLYCDFASKRILDRDTLAFSGKRILDVGCGHGRLMGYFKEKGATPFGIDISLGAVKVTREIGLKAIVADARNLPFNDNVFDISFSLGVLEHFEDTESAIREQIRVVSPGGVVIIIVPNLFSPYVIAAILWHTLRGSIRYGLVTCSGKMYTKTQLKHLMQKSGCKDVAVEAYHSSAVLKFITGKVHTKLATRIENMFLNQYIGHLLFAKGIKK